MDCSRDQRVPVLLVTDTEITSEVAATALLILNEELTLTTFWTAGFQLQVTVPTDALMFIQFGIFFPSAKNVTFPALSVVALRITTFPFGTVFTDPAIDIPTVGGANCVNVTYPCPEFVPVDPFKRTPV